MPFNLKQKTVIEDDDFTPVELPNNRNDGDSGDLMELPSEMAILPVRNMVTFPGTVVPLSIQREKSQKLLLDLLPANKLVVAVCQKNPDVDDPAPDDLYDVGTAVFILKLLKLEAGAQSLITQGLVRVRITKWLETQPYLRARIEKIEDRTDDSKKTEAMVVSVRGLAHRVVDLSPSIPNEANLVIDGIETPGGLSDFLASNMQLDIAERQVLLEEADVSARLRKMIVELQKQLEILELSDKIRNQVRSEIDKSQREFFLNEQLKAIQKELGQLDEKGVEIEQLREKLVAAKLPEDVTVETDRELDRLTKLPASSPDYQVVRTYLDILSELPWSVSTIDIRDIKRAEKVLNEDHYDLDKVKRRILEYLAVRSLAPDSRGPILCFTGPPGVGKTSLGQSIARALDRKFIHMSLGGIRDEAELRGHRRTYIGAMPGRIIQEIRKAGANNPVFMLDELDKVGNDFRGDPTSALLEILDPAQNDSFQDHYLNVPFSLRNVMFIGTANYMGAIPAPLRDRMEIIEIPGYTQLEKLQIASRYLVRRQIEANGLNDKQIRWNENAIEKIVREYTREAGVRELEREIGSVCRGVAAMVVAGKCRQRTVTPKLITQLLGPRQFEDELAMRTSCHGVATGLAFTTAGGTIIFIEVTMYPGRGGLLLTGQIGNVMKESAQAALSLVKTMAENEDIDVRGLMKNDIHVHVPAGAIPKDGPSAGVSIFTALMSLLANRSVRPDVAMTGEITLRGLVLPIGGVKEKVLAAQQAGIKTVILPAQNEKDLVDVPEDTRCALKFVFAKTVDDVLSAALKPHRKRLTTVRGNKKRGI